MNHLTIPLMVICDNSRYTIELLGGKTAIIWDKQFQREQRVELDEMYPKEWRIYQLENGISRLETKRYLMLPSFKEYVEFFTVPSLVDDLITFYEFVYEDTLETENMEVAS